MTALSVFVTIVLVALASLHAIWGFRIWWPVADETGLARAVVGARNIQKMPGQLACFAVTAALLIAAVLPWVRGPVAPIASIGFCAVFVFRGALGFTPGWQARMPEEPFHTLDTRYFSPLCLALGFSFALLIWSAIS